jgi:SAM-dependent methyltransferase
MLHQTTDLLASHLDARNLGTAPLAFRGGTEASPVGQPGCNRMASRLESIKGLAVRTADCILAHWYLLPGLHFHRFRVRLGMASIWRIRRINHTALRWILHDSSRASSYLDFHFAWKALAGGEPIGHYLDVSSPWLFPLVLLSRCDISSAMLITNEANTLRDLLNMSAVARQARTFCEQSIAAAKDASYDTITSLAWLGHVKDDVALLRKLWRSLKPGGTLLISIPCASQSADLYAGLSAGNASAPRTFVRRLYDPVALRERIFAEIGQPRRFVLYGERAPSARNPRLASGTAAAARPARLGSLTVGRNWRSYSRMAELPGEGIIAMKFVKGSGRPNSPDSGPSYRLA